MIPRSFLLLFGLALIASAAIIPAHTATHPANQGMTKGFCYSDTNAPSVYFSNIFDVAIKARSGLSTQPLNNAFYNHLVEIYDYKTRANYPTGCSLFETRSQAEMRRNQLVSEAQRASKQVVDVSWNPGPIVEEPMGDGVSIGPKVPPAIHTFCALGNADTMYFSAVFDSVGPLNIQAWNNGFKEFLSRTYGFEAEVEPTCTPLNTLREAEQILKARIGGVRYNRHKAVETGWKFGPNAVTRPRPKPTPKPDDDAEPVALGPASRPAPASPSADIRQFATQEAPLALAYCQNDRMIAGSFDCYCIQRAVYNYRMEHASEPGQPEPLANLFAKDKLDCRGCIGQFVEMWATSHAQSQSLPRPVAECVAKRYVASLRAKPYPAHVKELFKAAMTACK